MNQQHLNTSEKKKKKKSREFAETLQSMSSAEKKLDNLSVWQLNICHLEL